MYTLVLVTACLCVSAFAQSVEYFAPENARKYFNDFINNFGKQYDSKIEKETRFQIFKKNLEEVNRLNKENTTAVFGITQFMDMTAEEFVGKYIYLRDKEDLDLCDTVKSDKDVHYKYAPESYDWRDKKAVTPVKNQDHCGSWWAFAATGHIEGQYAIKHKKLLAFSEQELVDCDNGSGGCHGGWITSAFKALIAKGGQMKESDYKYKGKQGKCRAKKSKIVAKVSACTSYNLTSQEKLKKLLYKTGPIAIALQSSTLRFYKKGIFPDWMCLGNINHGVLLVGYGTENGKPFWILKNSWGTSYGENGYFRLQRSNNRLGACDMLNEAMATATVE